MADIHTQLVELLQREGATFRVIEHEPEGRTEVIAKIRGNRSDTIAEYRQALLEENDPHTRKLLGIELFEAGYWTEALSELRKAEHDGERDDLVIFRIASLLDGIGQPNQAKLEYQRFLESPLCVNSPPDRRCETAKKLLEKTPE